MNNFDLEKARTQVFWQLLPIRGEYKVKNLAIVVSKFVQTNLNTCIWVSFGTLAPAIQIPNSFVRGGGSAANQVLGIFHVVARTDTLDKAWTAS